MCSSETGSLVTFKFLLSNGGGEQEEYFPAPYWFSDSNDYSYRVERTKMPEKYLGKMAKDFKWDVYGTDTNFQKKIINAFVLQFMETFLVQHRGLYIYSSTKGTGKTLLACCLGNEIAKRYGVNVKFVTAPDYLELVKEKDSDMKQQCKDCDLLILDDFGTQDCTKDWINETFFALIDRRNSNLCSTIITSNIPKHNKVIDDRIQSRINEMCLEIHLPEFSVRDKKTEAEEKQFLDLILGDE